MSEVIHCVLADIMNTEYDNTSLDNEDANPEGFCIVSKKNTRPSWVTVGTK